MNPAAPSPSDSSIAQAYQEARDGKFVHTNIVGLFALIDKRAREIDASAPAAAVGGDEDSPTVSVDLWEAYKAWPEDLRKKLSMHDLRRMSGWKPPLGNAFRDGVAEQWLKSKATPAAPVGGFVVDQVNVADLAISQGNWGQHDGSTIIGWRVSAETLRGMGSASMCLPKEIREDLERLRAIATWWETGAAERMTQLKAALEQVDDRDTRRYLWDSILPLIHAIAPPAAQPSAKDGVRGEDCCVCGWGEGPHGKKDCANELPPAFALYVGTHEDEHGKVTAMVEVFGDAGGLKRNLYTEEQMRTYRQATTAAGLVDEVVAVDVVTHDCGYGFSGWAAMSDGSIAARTTRLHATPEQAQAEVSAILTKNRNPQA